MPTGPQAIRGLTTTKMALSVDLEAVLQKADGYQQFYLMRVEGEGRAAKRVSCIPLWRLTRL